MGTALSLVLLLVVALATLSLTARSAFTDEQEREGEPNQGRPSWQTVALGLAFVGSVAGIIILLV